MSKLGCWFAEITGRDGHRASCPRCQARARFDAGIRRIAGPVEVHAADSGILSRAITAGLAARAEGVVVGVGRTEHAWLSDRGRAWRRPAIVGFALAAAAVVALWLARGSHGGDGVITTADAGIGRPLAQGEPIAVGHAQVIASEGALAVRTGPTEIWLGRGQVEVDVDPEPHLPFAVRTPRFTVRVLGTHFVVSETGVHVDRGAVQIADADGHVVVPRLAAGERWLVSQWLAKATSPASGDAATADADLIEMDATSGRQTASSGSQTASSGGQTNGHRGSAAAAATKQASIAAKLSVLRDDISHGRNIPDTRAELERLARAASSRSERADAESLIAESYNDTGQPAEAQRRLTELADRYRDLPVGEADLYFASIAARRAGHTDDERRLLETYISRYPSGSLLAQARKRLDAIAKGR